MKLCIDCKYHVQETLSMRQTGTRGMLWWKEKVYDPEFVFHNCSCPVIDPVTGENKNLYKNSCFFMRAGDCGQEGKFWEAK